MKSLRIPSAIFSLCVIPTEIHAQDGGQLYALYCSACHNADGKGAGNGAFPPLAASPYVLADPELAIKIVLHGIHGPIDVLGKTYNLEMPPQGAAIVDDQIAAILTYVRSSWGNKASAVTPDFVKKIRAETTSRSGHWTAAELVKLHPIRQKLPLTDLLSHTYSGEWKDLPDFSKLTPTATEEEPSGKIEIPKIKKGKKAKAASSGKLGIVWEGNLNVPATGGYTFRLEADDGGRILIDGREVAKVTGVGPAKKRGTQGNIQLAAGTRKFRLEYYDVLGAQEIHISWQKMGDKEWAYLTDETGGKTWPPIVLAPKAGRPVIYRNFISGTTPRAIGFGFPGGVNLAYSADHLAPELIWTGDFIDAGHHWTDRGIGNEPPAGQKAVNLTSTPALPAGALFRGYKLDSTGFPTFSVTLGELVLLDSYTTCQPPTLIRHLKVSGKSSSQSTLTLADTAQVTAPGTFDIGGKLTVIAKSARLDGGKLVLPLVPGTTTEIRYLWK
jgi:mono/diheme cytochrome c family protein